MKDLGRDFLKQLEAFFVNYHQQDKGAFRILGSRGARAAQEHVTTAMKARRRHK